MVKRSWLLVAGGMLIPMFSITGQPARVETVLIGTWENLIARSCLYVLDTLDPLCTFIYFITADAAEPIPKQLKDGLVTQPMRDPLPQRLNPQEAPCRQAVLQQKGSYSLPCMLSLQPCLHTKAGVCPTAGGLPSGVVL